VNHQCSFGLTSSSSRLAEPRLYSSVYQLYFESLPKLAGSTEFGDASIRERLSCSLIDREGLTKIGLKR